MDPPKHRHADDRAVIAVVALVAVIGSILGTTIAFGIVYDLGTAGSLFSVLAVPIAVAIFYAARLLHRGIRRARLAALLDEDRRDRAHVMSTINLCLHLATGASKFDGVAMALGMSTIRHIATHVSSIGSQHDHHLSVDGQKIVDDVCDASFGALGAGLCAHVDFADIALLLSHLEDELLPLDDPQLEARRRQAAGIEDSPPE